MRTESLLMNLIINSTQQQFLHWSCFPELSKLWQEEKNGDLVSLSFCSSLKDKRQFWLAFTLPIFLLQLLHRAQQLFCAAFIPPQCQNPLETRLLLLWLSFHALFIALRDQDEPASLPDRNKVRFSLFGGSHSGRYHHGSQKHRLLCSTGQRETLECHGHSNCLAQMWMEPVGGGSNTRGMIGKQEEVKEREQLEGKKNKGWRVT